ncbi:7-methyl-GTP pyrophosphatase isoform X2 [Punica granatum]|uniref:7-methyl-GTP pyrophosphatase isoform X2 n=1 Tax=Punica granatum TaxID=22663 RepID=A0A6P8DQ77_PUNGR|nr:7-methyl-GTP pyrophosphatase isoform X2 [Punica granatum]
MASDEIPRPPLKIILGSKSMARRQILAEMGYDFTVMTADIDEKAIRKENPEELVVALAEAKADAIISRLQNTAHSKEDANATLLITADTVVVYEGTIREKPSSKDEAREFIQGYSGGQAAVVGSVCVTNLKTGMRKVGWDLAEVYFYEIPAQVIDSLIDEGVTLNVAGGLKLEHPQTFPFVKEVVLSLSLSLCPRTNLQWSVKVAFQF